MKIYKTALGKSVDLDRLILQNENTIALGNMKVNARGDELGPGGIVQTPRSDRVSEHYKVNSRNHVPTDDTVFESSEHAKSKPAFASATPASTVESTVELKNQSINNDLPQVVTEDMAANVESNQELPNLVDSVAKPKKVNLNTKNENRRVRRIT